MTDDLFAIAECKEGRVRLKCRADFRPNWIGFVCEVPDGEAGFLSIRRITIYGLGVSGSFPLFSHEVRYPFALMRGETFTVEIPVFWPGDHS